MVPNAAGSHLYVFRNRATQQLDSDALQWNGARGPASLYVTADSPLRVYEMPLL
jgi:hypothetical protein